MFRVGMKVVCIDDRPPFWDARRLLRRGSTYEIAFISDGYSDGGIGLHLHEVATGIQRSDGSGEQGFSPPRFRPVVSRPTSIEIFTKLLTPARERVSNLCGNND